MGESFGSSAEARGEVVFNTWMTGYQEVLTDPSYADQMVCMTYPLIGNYGINSGDSQSRKIQVKGFIVKEAAEGPNHWQMERLLADELAAAGVPGIKGVDTRALTRHIREYGALKGVITCDLSNLEETVREIQTWRNSELPVPEVSTREIYTLPALAPAADGSYYKVAALDFGIKGNILQAMRFKGFEVAVFPYNASVRDILGA
jgi:carbamoyl-phosphate synthase small subunit